MNKTFNRRLIHSIVHIQDGCVLMKSNKKMIWSYVGTSVHSIVKSIAASMEVSISEYVRQLVIDDLDSRSIFTSKVKQGV